MLNKNLSFVMLVDVQEKFRGHMLHEASFLLRCTHILKAAKALNVPVIVSEQYPKGLGQTVAELSELLPEDATILPKHHFSAWQDDALQVALRDVMRERPQMVVCGLEAHVCVLQTALDFMDNGGQLFAVTDAISSRTEDNRQLAFARMRQHGADIINTEMLVTEWCRAAKTDDFSAIKHLMRETV